MWSGVEVRVLVTKAKNNSLGRSNNEQYRNEKKLNATRPMIKRKREVLQTVQHHVSGLVVMKTREFLSRPGDDAHFLFRQSRRR
jgi:hypothetical protein